ncbi:hypothetical protein NIES3275_11240 [Microchaete diplosiphon NIES-3275]|nr:hypothetical protein NIES3275_11240 [Microchaete diplosiphon NIES-3275]
MTEQRYVNEHTKNEALQIIDLFSHFQKYL